MDEYKAYLRIRRVFDDSLVHSVGVNNLSENHIDRVISGMLINMADGFYVDDSEVESARGSLNSD